MITEKQYLEQIAKENTEALSKYLANGGESLNASLGLRSRSRSGKRSWDANISDRNRLSKGLSLNDLRAKLPRPDSFV